MAKYVYPAVFTPEEEGGFSVFFPDFDGCYTCGDNLQDAIMMAEDVLAFYLYDEEKEGHMIPAASKLENVKLNVGAVSYTHLDVYKRQRLFCPDL